MNIRGVSEIERKIRVSYEILLPETSVITIKLASFDAATLKRNINRRVTDKAVINVWVDAAVVEDVLEVAVTTSTALSAATPRVRQTAHRKGRPDISRPSGAASGVQGPGVHGVSLVLGLVMSANVLAPASCHV